MATQKRLPRYTSYPTAPHFRPLEAGEAEAALARCSGPLSIYVHVPFCKKLCWYCGCNTTIRRDTAAADPYLEVVERELELVSARLGDGAHMVQLHLGGGTPTFLEAHQRTQLIELLKRHLTLSDDKEWSIEVDPRTAEPDDMDQMVELGFGRFSFGVQDFDDEVLESVNRAQPAALTERLVERLGALGDVPFNVDLMTGLPHQTPERYATTVARLLELRPHRVAVFPYAHVPWMKPAQKHLERVGVPGPDVREALFEVARSGLEGAGYRRIGMDHFVRPDDPLAIAQDQGTLHRNFQGYTTHRGLDLIGLGVSAIGSFGGVYAANPRDLAGWQDAVDAGRLPAERGFVLTEEDRLRRAVITQIMCYQRVRWADHGGSWAFDHFRVERARLEALVSRGWVEVSPEGIEVAPGAIDRLMEVCSVFDAYLPQELAAA